MRKISAQTLRRIIQTEAKKVLWEEKRDDQERKVFNSASDLLSAIEDFKDSATDEQLISLKSAMDQMNRHLTDMRKNSENYTDKPENTVIIGGNKGSDN